MWAWYQNFWEEGKDKEEGKYYHPGIHLETTPVGWV